MHPLLLLKDLHDELMYYQYQTKCPDILYHIIFDNQWQKQYELSKKKSSSASSTSRKKSTKSTGGLKLSDSNKTEETDPRIQRILKNAADVGSEICIGSMKILNSLMGRW